MTRVRYDARDAESAPWVPPIPPSWDKSLRTFAQAVGSAGVRLEGLRRDAGGDLASHVLGRAVTQGAVALAEGVASATIRTELQVSLVTIM